MRIPVQKHHLRLATWSSLSAGAVFGFIELTDEFYEGELRQFDRGILNYFVLELREAWLNGPAVDITALGSITLTSLFTLIAVVSLLIARDRLGAVELALATTGGAAIMALSKTLIARPRPAFVEQLVDVHSFSYPSGHSLMSMVLYVSLALVIGRKLGSWRWRVFLLAFAGLLSSLIGLSRIYLGVHYPSDVLSGLALGGAWAFALHGLIDYFFYREPKTV